MSQTLSGEIDRITFHNPENGYCVLRVLVPGQREPVVVTGSLLMVAAGEHLTARGNWTLHPEHGRQFEAIELVSSTPDSAAGIERFLGSGHVKGLGPALAARIVKLYGARSFEILDRYPEVLGHIKRIGPERLKTIRESWREQRVVRDIASFLMRYGVGPARAVSIYRTYGEESIARVTENPYQLADDVRGIGFRTADELAQRLGIDPQSPHRLRAAARHTLEGLADQGHCGFPEAAVIERTRALLTPAASRDQGNEPEGSLDSAPAEQPPAPPDDMARRDERQRIAAALELLIDEHEVIRDWTGRPPLLFLKALYFAEKGVAESVRQRLDSSRPHPLPAIEMDAALAWVQSRLGVALAEGQQEALRAACRHRFLIVTGGPGVGKTTLVRSLLEIFEAKRLRCVLAAPTGRAAKRLAETTGRPARTLHRLLEFAPRTGDFLRNREHALEGDLFVLDEASMLDVQLSNAFLRAIPERAAVVLVGDIDQLPSVGPGSVLADLIAAGTAPVARLTQIFRQAQESRIVAAAHAINSGEVPESAPAGVLSDFYFIESETPESIRDTILKLLHERIPKRFGLNPREAVQVLCPMNRGLLGARQLNLALQQSFQEGTATAQVERYGWTFRAGDRVLQTVNNYDREVFNGDLGVVLSIDPVEQELIASFSGQEVAYDFGDLDELSLAYALTIHKSQGSEYPCVIVPLHSQHYVMLQRNLLYTAVTRGRKLVVLVGTTQALELCVSRRDAQKRVTRLTERLLRE